MARPANYLTKIEKISGAADTKPLIMGGNKSGDPARKANK
jgi:hypothetical protein